MTRNVSHTMTAEQQANWARMAQLTPRERVLQKPHHKAGKNVTIKKVSARPVACKTSATETPKPARNWACPDGTPHHWLCGQMTQGVTPERCKKCGRERAVVSPDYGDHRVYHTRYENAG